MKAVFNPFTGALDWIDPNAAETDPVFSAWLEDLSDYMNLSESIVPGGPERKYFDVLHNLTVAEDAEITGDISAANLSGTNTGDQDLSAYLTAETDPIFAAWLAAGNDCPTYIRIVSTGQSEGDLHLSDGTNWNTSKAQIKHIRVATASTDWDAYLLFNDNGYAANDAIMPRLQIMEQGSGNKDVYLDLPYEDEDASKEVHLYLIDNSGANAFSIYITGFKLK